MAPTESPLPTRVTMATRRKARTSSTNPESLPELFLLWAMAIFMTCAAVQGLIFILISLGGLVEVASLHLSMFHRQLLPFWTSLPALDLPAVTCLTLGLSALALYTDVKSLHLPTLLYQTTVLVTGIKEDRLLLVVGPSLILGLAVLATLVMVATSHRPLYTIPHLTGGRTHANKPTKCKVNVETNTFVFKTKKSSAEEKMNKSAATMPMAEETVVEMETKTAEPEPQAVSIYPDMSSIVG